MALTMDTLAKKKEDTKVLILPLILGLRDKGLDHVLPLQPAHVVNHLAVKVRIVISLIIARCGSVIVKTTPEQGL